LGFAPCTPNIYILQRVFGDMQDKDKLDNVSDDFSSDDEDDLLLDDWEDLGVDEELAMMAIDELSIKVGSHKVGILIFSKKI
jgi:hypothetical protein